MKNENTRDKQLLGFFLTLFSLVLFAFAAQARDVTFAWNANSDEIDGYRLHYKTGTSGGSPYNGTGATEGNSPVDMGNVTRFTLHGLSDTETYHFVMTAFSGTLQSNYTTEHTLEALPVTTPTEGITATFAWIPNKETNLAGYEIQYGTASGDYSNIIDVGNPDPVDGRIQTRVDDLIEGTTYYFSLVAYNADGVKSTPTTEIIWTATSGAGDGNTTIDTGSSFSTAEDQTVSGTVAAGNDTGISYQIQQNVSHGTLFLKTDTGQFTYTPQAGFTGTDSFTFQTSDGHTATVSITITPVNDTPVTLPEAEIFGDTPDSNHPGTLTDTFTNVNNDNNASAKNLNTWSWSNPAPNKPSNTIIIKTDISALPKNLQITEAKLYLYQTDFSGETTYENSIHKITGKNPIINQVTGYNAYNGEPWTAVETGTTHSDIPLGLADIDQAEDSIVLGTKSGYQTWTITSMVQDWISDPAGNFGLLISGVETNIGTGRIFAASENQEESYRPKLVIRYLKKPAKPSVISAKKIK
ncbi:MAG: DNRLRE domain-containing protein [Thermodesulfobacteriota bacterium]|nr:DNRLRE domain-containing protein [Thermodesulfobacteriota bacterium]